MMCFYSVLVVMLYNYFVVLYLLLNAKLNVDFWLFFLRFISIWNFDQSNNKDTIQITARCPNFDLA